MRFLQKAPDGGTNSGVTGYFLIEIKWLFTIVLLRFNKGSREAYHEHAFNAWTLWLKGHVKEHHLDRPDDPLEFRGGQVKYTPRTCFHKIEGIETTWALSFRGPWRDFWREWRDGKVVWLTHGRLEVEQS